MSSYYSRIVRSPEGGTIALRGGEVPSAGYLIGGVVSALILQGDPLQDEPDVTAFASYLTDWVPAAGFLGWWTDGETGLVWVDGTSHVADRVEAERLCRERGEIAFYDIEGDREVRVAGAEGAA